MPRRPSSSNPTTGPGDPGAWSRSADLPPLSVRRRGGPAAPAAVPVPHPCGNLLTSSPSRGPLGVLSPARGLSPDDRTGLRCLLEAALETPGGTAAWPLTLITSPFAADHGALRNGTCRPPSSSKLTQYLRSTSRRGVRAGRRTNLVRARAFRVHRPVGEGLETGRGVPAPPPPQKEVRRRRQTPAL